MLSIRTPQLTLAAEQSGSGPDLVLLHGLTATRRYVVMGSRLLERSGCRVLAYDARGHGESEPAPSPSGYRYADLVADLACVLERCRGPAVLVGSSMGAHTAVAAALAHPDLVAAVALITPAYLPDRHGDPAALARWDALADGLERGGVEGFVAAHAQGAPGGRWAPTVERVVRQRLSAHRHPQAVSDALRTVPRSRPFAELSDLAALPPTLVVGSRDDADPGHPLAVARAYAAAIPGAGLVLEAEGASPLAWQGGALSRAILTWLGDADVLDTV